LPFEDGWVLGFDEIEEILLYGPKSSEPFLIFRLIKFLSLKIDCTVEISKLIHKCVWLFIWDHEPSENVNGVLHASEMCDERSVLSLDSNHFVFLFFGNIDHELNIIRLSALCHCTQNCRLTIQNIVVKSNSFSEAFIFQLSSACIQVCFLAIACGFKLFDE